ncbi:hypothetical protein AZF37_09390 [endosymbiont 'TC1' of Trimyema compressum]|uniref:hypothetical protein n=1 Tax=endosymbiont 'TC1' of Trimyema compressum TaxID=243899 RepID=UPI0007F06ACD|nr:hypothetical protein [endosymbiont 'TC1' of Trimyema compressum]AMP21330.1 hypothetical protein AZF37_09390 [endosymbiont 'TC1' of Trimyema compressum]
MLFERDWLRDKEHTASLILTLKKISEKYKNHVNQLFSFEAGRSLYDLGSILIEEDNRKMALAIMIFFLKIIKILKITFYRK